MRGLLGCLLFLQVGSALSAQSVLERTPNLQGTWTAERGTAEFVLAHRFEFINGGDELFNVPTLTFAVGLPAGFTLGLNYTSFSEVVASQIAGNETEYWLKRGFTAGDRASFAAIAAYNTAAASLDGAVSTRFEFGRLAVLGEVRGFRDRSGTGDPGAAAALGAMLRLTPYLGVAADVGTTFYPDTVRQSPWSAGLAIGIPGSPHTMSLHASNGGATTLQGASHEKVVGPKSVRYGFSFTVPLGGAGRWLRIFQPGPVAPPQVETGADARVEMRQIEFRPREIRIRVGETVEWINLDPLVHTVTADDGSWASEFMQEGERFRRRFDVPGRYPYHCVPHPQMRGVVVVLPAAGSPEAMKR